MATHATFPLEPPIQHRGRRYRIALALAGAGLVCSLVLKPISDETIFAPLLAVTAVSVWYGGLLPGIVTMAVAWVGELFLIDPVLSIYVERTSDRSHWIISFGVALAIVWVTSALRAAEAGASARATEARRAGRQTERLQTLASALSAAATPAEVARALVEAGAGALGARGGSLALVVGDELEIVDPGNSPGQTLRPGLRLPLEARTAVGEAIRTGQLCWAGSHDEIAERFPDGLAIAPTANGVIAVPLRAGGELVAAIGFQYVRNGSIDEERLALAELAADLGGQALERARLFEDERGLREGLDHVLRVAPRAGGGSPAEVAAGICREARRTFGADAALMLSIVDERRFAVDWREPPSVLAPPGHIMQISDLPDLSGAMVTGEVMWVPDMLESVRGEALELAKTLGTVSALRIPVAVAGRVDRVLVLQWNQRVGDPSPTHLALARRFADQAGLALEQADRRQAEDEAARRVDETRRLLDFTSALAGAVTSADVIDSVLTQGAQALEARGAIVVLRDGEELVVEGVTGVAPEEQRRQRLSLVDSTPLTDAIRRVETVVIESPDDRRRRYPLLGATEQRAQAFVAVPFESRGVAIGGVGFEFDRPRRLGEDEREFLAAFARQASQALDRALLHDAEHGSRARAEQIAARLAQLHALAVALGRCRSPAEVAEVVSRQVVGVLRARTASVYAIDAAGEALELIGRAGAPSPQAERYERVPLDSELPLAEVTRTGELVWFDEIRARHADEEIWHGAGALAWGIAPLAVQERIVGALTVSFASPEQLDEDGRRFFETIARQAAQPLARVQLLEVEQAARRAAEAASERTRRLHELTEALAAAQTPAEVAALAVSRGLAALDASAGALYVRPAGAAHVLLAAQAGYDDRLAGREQVPLDAPTPVTQVTRTGEVLELPFGADPAGVLDEAGATGEAGLCVPLASPDGVVGALFLSFPGDEPISADERDFVASLAVQCAQALERARLLEAEQAAAARLRRLQGVTAALSRAVLVEEVGRVCLEEAQAALAAHGGSVALIGSDGDVLERVVSIGRASTSGQPVVVPLAADVPIAEAARADEPVRSADLIALPLRSARGVVGAIEIEGVGELTTEDEAWLVAIAGQCAQAIERSRLYEVERATRERIERLQRLTAALSTALTPGQIAAVAVVAGSDALDAPAGLVAITQDDAGELEVAATRGLPAELVERLASSDPQLPLSEAFVERRTIVLQSAREIDSAYPGLRDEREQGAPESLVTLPLIAAGRSLGAALFAWPDERALQPEERVLLQTVAAQCAQALDRARRYESERLIAETLQRSVLPDRLPELPGVGLAGRYLPGTAGMEVGGDWFDVIQLENGRLGLVVGDVVGKGVRAASTMGQLRNALRAFALELLKPATAVSRLNSLMESLGDSPFATLAYLTLDPERRVCRYTVAGHPPPLMQRADGSVEVLDGGRSLPIGVGTDVDFDQATIELEPGSTVLLYTDGLIERRDRPLDQGLEALADALAACADMEPERLVDAVLEQMLAEDRSDDVAVLAVRLAPVPAGFRLCVTAERASLEGLRADLRAWLERTPATDAQARDIVLACWEACANAVEHGGDERGPLELDLALSDDRVRVRVADSGAWIPPSARGGRPPGLGLQLIDALMDSLEVAGTPKGTVVTMERRVGAT